MEALLIFTNRLSVQTIWSRTSFFVSGTALFSSCHCEREQAATSSTAGHLGIVLDKAIIHVNNHHISTSPFNTPLQYLSVRKLG